MQTSIWFNQNISEGRPKVYHYFLFFSPNGSHEMIHPANNFTLKFIKPKPSLKISTQHIYSRPTQHLQPTRIEINPFPSYHKLMDTKAQLKLKSKIQEIKIRKTITIFKSRSNPQPFPKLHF